MSNSTIARNLAPVAHESRPVAAAAERTGAGRAALASLALTLLLPSLNTSIANVALPTLAQAFAASFAAVQWVVIAYLLAITTLVVGAGRLGDLLGRRRLLLVGIAVFTVASVAAGAASTLGLLLAARAAQGVGAAIMTALTMAMVGETVPSARTGRAIGLLGAMSAVGTALGPSLGGGLIAALGWRAVFFVNVPFGLAAFLLVRRFVPRDRRGAKARVRFDYAGTLLLALTLAAYALAVTLGRGRFGGLNLALLAGAAIGAGLFVRAQATAESPLVRFAVFRERVLGASLTMSALVATVLMATLVVGPFYLAGALGLGAANVGVVMSLGPLVAALTGVPAGRMVDRFGSVRMTLAGLSAIAAGCVGLAALAGTLAVGGYAAAIMMVTAGYALFQTANNTSVLTGVSADQRGVISGLLNLSRNLGLVTGASVMGAVFAWGAATTDIAVAAPEAVRMGMRLVFGVAALLMAVAFGIAAWSRTKSAR